MSVIKTQDEYFLLYIPAGGLTVNPLDKTKAGAIRTSVPAGDGYKVNYTYRDG